MYACVLVLPHLSHPKPRQCTLHSRVSRLPQMRWAGCCPCFGEGLEGVGGGMWEQWQQLEQDCHCFLCTSTGPKNATRVWIGAKWRCCLRENALFWQMQQALRFSTVLSVFVQAQVRTYTRRLLHCTHQGTVLDIFTYQLPQFCSYFTWSQSFVQTRKHEGIQGRKMRSWIMSKVKTNTHCPF